MPDWLPLRRKLFVYYPQNKYNTGSAVQSFLRCLANLSQLLPIWVGKLVQAHSFHCLSGRVTRFLDKNQDSHDIRDFVPCPGQSTVGTLFVLIVRRAEGAHAAPCHVGLKEAPSVLHGRAPSRSPIVQGRLMCMFYFLKNLIYATVPPAPRKKSLDFSHFLSGQPTLCWGCKHGSQLCWWWRFVVCGYPCTGCWIEPTTKAHEMVAISVPISLC